jgi:hypothetical protein
MVLWDSLAAPCLSYLPATSSPYESWETMNLESIARLLVILGIILIVVGGLVLLAARLNLPFGRLPGDIFLQRENFTCAFPLATMIVLSILLTIILNIIVRLLNK